MTHGQGDTHARQVVRQSMMVSLITLGCIIAAVALSRVAAATSPPPPTGRAWPPAPAVSWPPARSGTWRA